MKKSAKKKSIKIGAVVGAVVVLLLLIAFCVRPVSVGYSYKNDDTNYHFNTFSKVTVSGEYAGVKTEKSYYYVERDGYVFINLLGSDNKDFKETIKDANEDELKLLKKSFGIKISAFKIGEDDSAITCTGAYVTVVVLAVVEVALVAVAVMSLKKKR